MSEVEGSGSPPADEVEGSSPQATPEDSQPHDRVQKRIDTLTKQRYEEKARADEAERRIKELESKVESPPKVEGAGDLPPNPNDYDEPADYQKDAADYTRRVTQQELDNRERIAADRQARESKEAKMVAYRSKVSSQATPEMLDQIANANVPISEAMQEALWTSEKATELTVFLAQHPEEADRLSRLDSISAAREMGRLEGSLESLTGKKVSDAPEPMKEPAGEDRTDNTAPSDDDDNETWLRKRRAQLKAKGKR